MKALSNIISREDTIDRTHYKFEHIREPRPSAMTPDVMLARQIGRLTPGCNSYLEGGWVMKQMTLTRTNMRISYSVTYHGLTRHVDTPAEAVTALRQLIAGRVAA